MPNTDEEIEAAAVARRAAADQEIAEWGFKGEKLATFYTRLIESGMKRNLAGVLTINAQAHAHVIEDEDED